MSGPRVSAVLDDPLTRERGSCVLLDGVTWATYLRLSGELQHRRVRLAYCDGSLEIMSPSYLHEACKEWLAIMVRVIAEELELDVVCGGSTTFRKKDLERGLEPDQCFYVAHAFQMIGRKRIDLDRDPPP